LPATKASHTVGANLTHGQARPCRWSGISLTRAATPSDRAHPRLRSATQLGLSSPTAWVSRATGDTNVRSNATMMMTTRWGTEGQHGRVRQQWFATRYEAASWTPFVLSPATARPPLPLPSFGLRTGLEIGDDPNGWDPSVNGRKGRDTSLTSGVSLSMNRKMQGAVALFQMGC
jgi:hypothetical protein